MSVMRVARYLMFFAVAALLASPMSAADPDPAGIEYFEKKVRPLLVAECYKCHSAETEKRGELVLDTKAGWEVGGDSGRIDWAYRLAVSRPVTDTERDAALAFIERYAEVAQEEGKGSGDLRLQAWARFCQALVASAEFQILD